MGSDLLKRPSDLISHQILLIPTKSQLKCVNYYKRGHGMTMTHGGNANRLKGWTEIGLDGVGGHLLVGTRNTKGTNPLGVVFPLRVSGF